MFWQISKIIYRIFISLYGPLKVEGSENVPREGGVIIVANHISDSDPPLLGTACPRQIHFMAKDELFRIPVLGWVLKRLEAFPVKRGFADRSALKTAMEYLDKSKVVGVFPEGMVSVTGELQPFLPGVSFLIRNKNAVVIPAVIIGSRRLLPYSWIIPKPAFHTIIVRFGKPIDFTDLASFEKHNKSEIITSRLRNAVENLLEDVQKNS